MSERLEGESNDDKYWEISVEYPIDTTGETPGKIHSFLRLGTAEQGLPASPEEVTDDTSVAYHRGHDLACLVQDFIDDTRQRGPHLPDQAHRDQQTAILHKKGGWRDHSDGNRVSTTRGDKVEVVRGNYKMLVLGRQDDSGNGADWDASGGLHQDGDFAPGAVTEIKWEEDPWGGTWTVTEETVKGNTITRYHGNVQEEHYGDTITTVMGSASGTDSIDGWDEGDASGEQKLNPVINETVYATAIAETTTVAGAVAETTSVGGAVTETTTVGGAVAETTTIGLGAVETTTIGGVAVETKTVGGAMTDTLNVGGALGEHKFVGGVAVDLTAVAGAVFEILAVGGVLIETTFVGGCHLELDASTIHIGIDLGGCIDVFLGFKLDVDISGTYEIEVFEHKEYKSKEEKTALEQKKLALTNTINALNYDANAGQANFNALKTAMKALQVSLGS